MQSRDDAKSGPRERQVFWVHEREYRAQEVALNAHKNSPAMRAPCEHVEKVEGLSEGLVYQGWATEDFIMSRERTMEEEKRHDGPQGYWSATFHQKDVLLQRLRSYLHLD